MITYETKDDKTYKTTTIVEEIDVGALEAELKEWQEMKEPSEEELRQRGETFHPYYTDRLEKIVELENKLKEVK